MILISHRGNTHGPFPLIENNPEYVDTTILLGYNVEIDVWVIEGTFHLGHDKPQYGVSLDWLNERKDKLWIHCKNIEALVYLSVNDKLHLFYHTDGIALTTKGFLWTVPGLLIGSKSIAAMPELIENWNIKNAYGICTDYIK